MNILQEELASQGYTVVPGAVAAASLEALLKGFREFVAGETGQHFGDLFTGPIIDHFHSHPDDESRVYDGFRRTRHLSELSLQPGVIAAVGAAMGGDVALLGKIVFRIDLPLETAQLAYWHQDHFYVKGDTRTLTAWIPLQDTPFEKGALGMMPGSHADGLLPHDLQIGKRHVPRSALGREIRIVEMAAGDLLLFHSLLVHSSNLNVSQGIRYSVQARFAPAGAPVDPGMGEAITVTARNG